MDADVGQGAPVASQPAPPPPAAGTLSDEPSRELVRGILQPAQLLQALGWPGPERELALPIPVDRRGIVDPGAARSLVVVAGGDPVALRETLCSVLERATEPVAATVALPAGTRPLDELLRTLELALPPLELRAAAEIEMPPGAERLLAGEELPWGWPEPPGAEITPSVAYLLMGMPNERAGGVGSVVQEARGLRALGATANVCLPSEALGRAELLFGNDDSLFSGYDRDAEIVRAAGGADIAVATEHTSMPLLRRLARARPELLCAYYVQDYEPLFAELGSVRSDRALLSYGALAHATLFAKTHFIRNVIAARHRVDVAKVAPSLDPATFNDAGRGEQVRDRLTVLAMLRPRTPRRRPRATLACLALINQALGSGVEIVTFGCEQSELDRAGLGEHSLVEHRGRLSSAEVARELRRSDVFIDGSAYQAFGRGGLEAMACGAVPVLPSLGGVREFATNGQNAIVLDDDSPESLAGAVIELAGDPDRLKRLQTAALATAGRFSIERAAQSQLELFRSLLASASA